MDPAAAFELAATTHLKVIDEASAQGTSDIQRFYCNSTVFVTGGSGFLGKQLIEKLFRSCNIKKLYMLLRAKKEKKLEDRLFEILQDPVFGAVRKQKPDFADRITTVQGDISEIRLGICDQDWAMMAEEVDVIFHVAATTRFDETVRDATFINVRGTREALLFGKTCKKLRSFIHVSTAYSHATSKTRGGDVLEQFHQSPLPPETMIQMAETIEKNRLDDITPAFIKGWPNTYTFTKAVAEEQVRLMSSELPVCIVRPSIVISSYREPCPAWLDSSSTYSASGFIIGSGLGLNHVMQTVKDTDMSLVPVDFVNNALMAAGWELGTRQQDGVRETAIYNMVTSKENKILWSSKSKQRLSSQPQLKFTLENGECTRSAKPTQEEKKKSKLEEYLLEAGNVCPTPLAVWKSFVVSTQYYYMFLCLTVLLHFIPALLMDGGLLILGKEPRFIKLYKKIHKLSVSLSYFMNNLHKMDDRNLSKLKEKLSDSDKIIFNFDMMPLNWPDLIKIWCIGVRKYILKDGLKDTEKAIKKQFWFGILNYIVLTVYGCMFCLILYRFFGFILGF